MLSRAPRVAIEASSPQQPGASRKGARTTDESAALPPHAPTKIFSTLLKGGREPAKKKTLDFRQ